jgi:hypothetical protein
MIPTPTLYCASSALSLGAYRIPPGDRHSHPIWFRKPVAPDRSSSSSKRRGLARLKIGLHVFPSEENQPCDASCNRDKIQECKSSFKDHEFPASGVDVSGHAQRCHGFQDAEGRQQSAEDQRGDTGPAPGSQQSDPGSDAPASEGKVQTILSV